MFVLQKLFGSGKLTPMCCSMDAAKVIVIKRGGMEKLAPLLQMIIFWWL
jgi:hypothetical protein